MSKGKMAGRKHSRRYTPKPKRPKATTTEKKGTIPTGTMHNKWNKLKTSLHLTLSVSGLFAFVSDVWWIPMIIKTSFISGYVLFLISNGLLLGLVIYLSVRWLYRKHQLATFVKRVGIVSASVAFLVFMLFFSLSLFSTYFATSQDGIEMPTFVDASTPITVYYGNRDDPVFYTKTTVGELEQQGEQVALKINGQSIFVVHIENDKLYIDTLVFAGVGNQSVTIRNSRIYGEKPDGWRTDQNKMNLEIQNQDGIPVLILEYESPYSIIVSGLFNTPLGICKVSNEGAIYELGDTLSDLGTYKVDRVFLHYFWDLFRRERVYGLEDAL